MKVGTLIYHPIYGPGRVVLHNSGPFYIVQFLLPTNLSSPHGKNHLCVSLNVCQKQERTPT